MDKYSNDQGQQDGNRHHEHHIDAGVTQRLEKDVVGKQVLVVLQVDALEAAVDDAVIFAEAHHERLDERVDGKDQQNDEGRRQVQIPLAVLQAAADGLVVLHSTAPVHTLARVLPSAPNTHSCPGRTRTAKLLPRCS